MAAPALQLNRADGETSGASVQSRSSDPATANADVSGASGLPRQWCDWHRRVRSRDDSAGLHRALTIPQMALAMACEQPHRIVFRQSWMGFYEEWSWLKLLREAAILARYYSDLGIRRGSRVVAMGDPGIISLASELAVMSLGAAVVNLYPSQPAEQFASVLNELRPDFFIIDGEQQRRKVGEIYAGTCPVPVLSFAQGAGRADGGGMPPAYRDAARAGSADAAAFLENVTQGRGDDPAFIVMTNLSAERPAFYEQSHSGYLASLGNLIGGCPGLAGAAHSTVALMPMAHVFGRASVYLPLLADVITHFPDPDVDPVEALRDVSPTLVLLEPLFLRKLAWKLTSALAQTTGMKRRAYRAAMWCARRRTRLPLLDWLARAAVFRPLRALVGMADVRCCVVGGSALPRSVSDIWASWGMTPVQLFILPGFGPVLSDTRLSDRFECTGSVRGGSDIEIRVSADRSLAVKAPNLGIRALRDADAHCQDGWFVTGDTGDVTDGIVRIHGRCSEAGAVLNGARQDLLNRVKESAFIQDALLVSRLHESARVLLDLDADVVGEWARSNDIVFKSFPDLARRKELVGLVRAELATALAAGDRDESVHEFEIIEAPMTVVHGHVTSARKIIARNAERFRPDVFHTMKQPA